MRLFSIYVTLSILCLRINAGSSVVVYSPGSLSTLLTQAQKDTCTQLTVRGKLNSADIKTLRHMAGYEEEGCSTGQLQILNLADAEFVNDKEPYMVLDAAKEKLAVAVYASRIRWGTTYFGLSPMERVNSKKMIDINRTDISLVNTEGPQYYHSRYYIGRDTDNKITEGDYATKTSSGAGNGHPFYVVRPPVLQVFFASDSFCGNDWDLINKYKVTKFKGHKLVIDNGKYLLCAYVQRGYLSDDMFYKCSALKKVILPSRMRVDKRNIKDETSQVAYITNGDEITIRYLGRYYNKRMRYCLGSLWIEPVSKEKILDSHASIDLINVLNRLHPMSIKTRYIPNIRISILIEHADGSDNERYEIDADKSHVIRLRDGECFKASRELLDVMRRLKVL